MIIVLIALWIVFSLAKGASRLASRIRLGAHRTVASEAPETAVA